jgi:hypothetical protein
MRFENSSGNQRFLGTCSGPQFAKMRSTHLERSQHLKKFFLLVSAVLRLSKLQHRRNKLCCSIRPQVVALRTFPSNASIGQLLQSCSQTPSSNRISNAPLATHLAMQLSEPPQPNDAYRFRQSRDLSSLFSPIPIAPQHRLPKQHQKPTQPFPPTFI